MRIGILHNAYRYRGGEERIVASESEGLRQRGHHVSNLTFDNRLEFAQLGRGLASAMRCAGGWNSHAASRIASWIREERLDLVHLHNLFPFITGAGPEMVARLRIPLVMTLHNFRLMCARGTLTRDGATCTACVDGSVHSAILNRCYRDSVVQSVSWAATIRRAGRFGRWQDAITTFIAPSEHVREMHVRAGLPADRIVVRPHFTNIQPHHGADRRGVVVVGRVEESKGIPELVRQWPSQAPTLTVIGEGPDLAAAQNTARANIRFLGQLATDGVARALGSAAVMVAPSRLPETFGLTLIEAAACQTPVVAFDTGATSSIVVDDLTGHVIRDTGMAQLIRKAIQLSENHLTRSRMGRAAHRRYRANYSPAAGVTALESIYDRAMHPQHKVSA